MKNLKYYDESTIEFHDKIVVGKKKTIKDPEYKNRLIALRGVIGEKYEEYETLFDKNKLNESIAVGFTSESKSDLLKLYSYKSKTIKSLKIKLTTVEGNRILNTCQNCTINSVNSFDHFLPKDIFPEYSVNPINLFPSCTECNGYKGTFYAHNGDERFLNLYLDELPTEQYLFVDIINKNGIIDVSFKLENIFNIDEGVFSLINSHYNRLHLLDRFRENCNGVVIELKHSFESMKEVLTREQIIEITKQKNKKNKILFGYNYWKSILELALIDSDEFMDSLFQ